MSVITLPNSGLGWDFRQCQNAPIPGGIGGYEYSGAQYLFLYQGSEFGVGDSKIHALKSTDLGVTWTDTGSIAIPSAGSGIPIPPVTYTTCMDGGTVYVMALDLDGTGTTPADAQAGPVQLWKYDLTSNSFDAGGPLGSAPTVWKGWNGTHYVPRSCVCLHLLRRGPGDMLLLYTGIETIGANTWTRIYAAHFDGSSCGTGVVLPGQSGIADAVVERCAAFDASHNLHIILGRFGDYHFWYSVAMDSGGGFGTFQTVETDAWQNDTSNLLNFAGTSDTIAFVGARNNSSANDNGDLAIYSAAGGTLNPVWSFHNLPSTANAVVDPEIAPDWIAALGYLDGTLHAFWTQTGHPHTWHITDKQGQIRGSTASATDLSTWSAETSVMGPLDTGTEHWGASQVAVWAGSGIGLGVLGNFEGYDSGGSGFPIETSRLLVVSPAGVVGPSVTCGAPPDGLVGTAYSHTFPATGGILPYTFAITTGTLPPGLLLATGTGNVSGTPTLAGTYPITLTVTDAVHATGTADCSITIKARTLGLSCAQPPNGVVGVPYDYIFPVTGGVPPFTFAIMSGTLPPGLTLDAANGEVSGVPTLAGDYAFTIEVDDTSGSVTGHCDILITVTTLPASGIGCGSPPDGELGVPYSHTFPVTEIPSGATVAYSITGGALPPGLTLNTSTGQVTGTPTTSGHYHFTVTATIT